MDKMFNIYVINLLDHKIKKKTLKLLWFQIQIMLETILRRKPDSSSCVPNILP